MKPLKRISIGLALVVFSFFPAYESLSMGKKCVEISSWDGFLADGTYCMIFLKECNYGNSYLKVYNNGNWTHTSWPTEK